jgi:hypothetical protein
MSARPDSHPPLHHRVRRRARTVYWLAVPLFLVSGVIWFLFQAATCWSGQTGPLQQRICAQSYLVPIGSFGFVLVMCGGLTLALGAIGVALAEDELPGDEEVGRGRPTWRRRTRELGRHLRHAPHGYRALDSFHRSFVVFAIRAFAAGAALLIGFLPYYYWYAFPPLLGLLISAGIFAAVVYLFRSPTADGDAPPVGV